MGGTRDLPTPDGAVLEALRFIESGRPDQAANELARALELAPERAELASTIARHAVELGALEVADDAARRAVQLEPTDSDARLLWARIQVRRALVAPGGAQAPEARSALEAAEENVRVCLEARPDRPRAWSLLALVQERLGHEGDALESWQQAHEVAPDDIEVSTGLAVAQAKAERFEEALEHFEAIAAARPRSSDAQINLGIALRGLERWSDALEAFTRAASLGPPSGRLQIHLGNTKLALEQPHAALEHFRAAIALEPESPEAVLLLARTLAAVGEVEAARAVLQKSRRTFPDDPELRALGIKLGADVEARQSDSSPFAPRGVAALTVEAQHFSIPDVLDFLANHRASGRLVVEGAGHRGIFVLSQGVLLGAQVPGVAPLWSWVVEGNRDLDETVSPEIGVEELQSRDDLDPEQVEEAVGRQGVAALLTVMGWPSEYARFFADEAAPGDRDPTAAIDLRQVLMEALRQWDEASGVVSDPATTD